MTQRFPFLKPFVELIYRFIPRRNHAVIYSWPDFEDSQIALETALQACDEVGEVILLLSDPAASPPWRIGTKTRLTKKDSVHGFLKFATARYVFFTHPCFARNFPKDVVSVNIWHGMPIKRIGWMLEGSHGIAAKYSLATSPFWADIMDRAMRPQDAVLVTGLPRNDRLFLDPKVARKKLGVSDTIGKIFVWLPTYRHSVRGEIREDGTESGNAFGMPGIDPVALNEYMATNNAMLFVKPHPMASSAHASSSHLQIIDDNWLHQQQLSLYEFLAAADSLISDISSVVIDFLLLDRPIIHAFSDLEAYGQTRGYSVEPITDYFAGPVATNYAELLAVMDSLFQGEDSHSVQRTKLRDLSHADTDPNASTRLLNQIGLNPIK